MVVVVWDVVVLAQLFIRDVLQEVVEVVDVKNKN
jgi:hypothetical protein